MNFKQQIAKYVTGNLSSSQLPNIGVQGLEEGLDTPSLCILAGLGKYDTPFEIEHYFKLTLDELHIALPDKRQAAIEYALAIVDELLSGDKDVVTATREIMQNAIGSYDFFSESKKYCYDSIGLEAAYGLLDTFDELSIAVKPWEEERTNDQLMVEVKLQLATELKSWKDKLKSGV
ncbi:MAG: hypothetical protein ACOH13_09860 [Flavobacteriales bacterium]